MEALRRLRIELRLGGWTLAGLLMVAAGALLGAPWLVLLGGLTVLSRWLTTLWSRHGLRRVEYARRLGQSRAVWGDEVELDVTVWNRKPLPVPLLQADDYVTDTLEVAGHPLEPSERPGLRSLQSTWSLLWFERVRRRLTIHAHRRGVFAFGPVRLTAGDLFERGSIDEERDLRATLVVRPRTVPLHPLGRLAARAPMGTVRATSLHADPAAFAGVRPYQPGDPVRSIHWRATARLRDPVAKRFEPVHERRILVVPDLQTVDGPHWLMVYDDDLLESLCVAAASVARAVLGRGSACGLLVGAQLSGAGRWAWLQPATGARQLGRIEDSLARVQPILSLPYERLLRTVPRRLSPGSTVVTIGVRSAAAYADPLRRLGRSGYRATHLALGADAAETSRRLADVGVDASAARLDPGWRTADALVLAS